MIDGYCYKRISDYKQLQYVVWETCTLWWYDLFIIISLASEAFTIWFCIKHQIFIESTTMYILILDFEVYFMMCVYCNYFFPCDFMTSSYMGRRLVHRGTIKKVSTQLVRLVWKLNLIHITLYYACIPKCVHHIAEWLIYTRWRLYQQQ